MAETTLTTTDERVQAYKQFIAKNPEYWHRYAGNQRTMFRRGFIAGYSNRAAGNNWNQGSKGIAYTAGYNNGWDAHKAQHP